MLGPLLFLVRKLHFELQAILMLITRRADLALALFSILLFPGVVLHELSHFLVAKILAVPTGHFSLIPQSTRDGKLRLGYVETAQVDIGRDALIGAAPLVAGGLFVAFAGLVKLDLLAIWRSFSVSDLPATLDGFASVFSQTDFWLWFYLIMVVSSTMMPSSSDRRAWLPLALVTGILFVAALVFGAGPWMAVKVAPVLNNALRSVAVVFGISGAVHLLVLFPLVLIRRGISKLTGMNIVR